MSTLLTSRASRLPVRPPLSDVLSGSRYEAYTYSYPHKTAYRPFDAPVALDKLWRNEDKSSLFLYFHVPFCEMRCGFCNLFTQVRPIDALPEQYITTMRNQAIRAREAIGDASYVRVAFGGGTPTYLAPRLLAQMFDIAQDIFGAQLTSVPVSLETSPDTATTDRLRLAKQRGVDRISIGIQSFIDTELKALGRPQTRASALAALERIAQEQFSTVNIDLIYGAAGQTTESFRESLDMALTFEPQQLYLYPLYVRPLTGLGRRRGLPVCTNEVVDGRDKLYQQGRDHLLDAGYEQVSLRMFRKPDDNEPARPVYCCQQDGMVGLGCGARSYVRDLHYSDDWAVSSTSVKGIIADWVGRRPESFAYAHYGFQLDDQEQRRRYLIQSVSMTEGLDLTQYQQRFGTVAFNDFGELAELIDAGMLTRQATKLVPSARGLAWADAIGPWLYSQSVQARMNEFELR